VTALGGEARSRLALIADALIPPGATMPSATQAGVPQSGIDRVLDHRPDLAAILERVTAEPLDGPEAARALVQALHREDRAAFSELLEAVAAAYFLDEDVARRLGYRRREEVPIVFDEDLDELVAPVLARGPAYRSADGV
jgi:hypothetical protein